MHEHEQLKISNCLEVAAVEVIFDAWETLVHASCWKGFRSLQNQSQVQASKTTPKKKMSTGTNIYI